MAYEHILPTGSDFLGTLQGSGKLKSRIINKLENALNSGKFNTYSGVY